MRRSYVMRFLRSLVTKEDATTAVEYCVMLAMILLVVIVGISTTGSGVAGWWSDIDSELDSNGF